MNWIRYSYGATRARATDPLSIGHQVQIHSAGLLVSIEQAGNSASQTAVTRLNSVQSSVTRLNSVNASHSRLNATQSEVSRK